MEKNLAPVLEYFSFFSYAPTFDEIHLFFPTKITKKELRALLDQHVKEKTVRLIKKHVSGAPTQSIGEWKMKLNDETYTLPQYSMRSKKKSSTGRENKIDGTIRTYVSFLKWCPFIRYVGVTGASAMSGLRHDDDIDLCIVSKRGHVWSARFISVILAKILRIHSPTGVCLNLYFDESDLSIHENKHNLYIAHEVLQMKPIFDKSDIYHRFLDQNGWISRYFPNALSDKKIGGSSQALLIVLAQHLIRLISSPFDLAFKWIQVPIIRRNNTAFYISNTQLWLFRNDFEKRLKERGLVI